jgi:ParB-like chromosome segregation protein Spo0J
MSRPKPRQPKVFCAYDKITVLERLKEHPGNPNKHPPEQIKLLAHIIAVSGWRNPIVVSNRSGLITKGHARLYAARALKAKTAPVDYQDYTSEQEEIADMIADNRIAELAEMDRAMLRDLAEQIDDGQFDMDLTGFDRQALEELMTATMPESDADAEPQIDKATEATGCTKKFRQTLFRVQLLSCFS